METIQICPVTECTWINDIVETDEPSVFAASQKTLAHLLREHPGLDDETWHEMVLCRIKLSDVVMNV